MDILQSSNTVTITGNIKSINDFQKIKATLDSIKESDGTIVLKILDSISITSSVIGYLNKLVLRDKVKLRIEVTSAILMELFDDLNLIQTFNVSHV